MRSPRGPVFLERHGYRRRRLMDAARLLPWIGGLVFLRPLLWASGDDTPPGTGVGGLYLFGAWGVLILAAALLARPLSRAATEEEQTLTRPRAPMERGP